MNKHELHGGARYVGGKVEKAIGDAVDSRPWQVDGVVDQVAGGAEHLYGRARSIAEDVVDAAPGLAEEARERASDAAHRAGDAARRGARDLRNSMSDRALLWTVAAGISGYALGWLLHGRRA